MAEIIEFPAQNGAEDTDELSREELLTLLERLRAEIAVLDEKEPKNMNSEAYETWADRHEELEDQVDEILELLEDE
mgnify:FL=1